MELTRLDLDGASNFLVNDAGEILYKDQDVLRVIPSQAEAATLIRRHSCLELGFNLLSLLIVPVIFLEDFSLSSLAVGVVVFALTSAPSIFFLRSKLAKMEPRKIVQTKSYLQQWKERFLALSPGQVLLLIFLSFLFAISSLLPLLNDESHTIITVVFALPISLMTLSLLGFYIKRQKREAEPASMAEQKTRHLQLELTKNLSAFLTATWIAVGVSALAACWFFFLKNVNELTTEWLLRDPKTEDAITFAEMAESYLDKAIVIVFVSTLLLLGIVAYVRRLWIISGKPVTLSSERYPFKASWEGLSQSLWLSMIVLFITFIVGYFCFHFRFDLPGLS